MAVQALLRLVGRGEALVAELLRLSEHIPPVFSLSDKTEQRLYGEILLDFRYQQQPYRSFLPEATAATRDPAGAARRFLATHDL